MSSFTSLLKKASNLIGLASGSDTLKPPALDGEIVYCKNNVCVYPPSARGANSRSVPGYLTVRCQTDEFVGSTLVLTWVPNDSLKGNPRSVENTPVNSLQGTPRISPCRKKQEFAKQECEPVDLQQANNGGGEYSARHGKSTFYVDKKRGDDPQQKQLKNNEHEPSNAGEDGDHEKSKQRLSSMNSNISVEMDGDNLVVTTEEIRGNRENAPGGLSPSSEQNTDAESISIDSPCSETFDEVQGMRNLMNDDTFTNNGITSGQGQGHVDIPEKTHNSNIRDSINLKLDLVTAASTDNNAPEIAVSGSPCNSQSSGSTSGPDSRPCSPPTSPMTPMSMASTPGDISDRSALMRGNPEAVAMKHNLMFPEESKDNSGPHKHGPRKNCGVFSVDLGQMRSLRLFYSDDECTTGQLVIASCESQYKILHFHHGGLNKLAKILEEFNLFKSSSDKTKEESNCKHFSVVRPEIPNEDCHPEEGIYDNVTETAWKRHMNGDGMIHDGFQLRKAIFFGGLRQELRAEAWPFLLQYFPFESTFEDRERIRNDKYIEYQNIRKLRENMSQSEQETFWRNIQCTVEKDVVRTDRSNPYFSGEDNPNIEILKHILLNYACAHPHYGYNQGMSDLLAPVLAELRHEADAYWCFEGLMQKTIFVSSPKDTDMDLQLLYLQELLRLMHPRFFSHLNQTQDGMELLFCHRWILLCFKREFVEKEAFQMWEACWAHYQTDYFHLFICLAIIIIYGEDVIQQELPADEMLLHFSSLAMHMNGKLVLRKARGLLHQFRLLATIPCTLRGLTTFCSHGMWDSGHVPKIQCTGVDCTTGNCIYDVSPEVSPVD